MTQSPYQAAVAAFDMLPPLQRRALFPLLGDPVRTVEEAQILPALLAEIDALLREREAGRNR